MRTLSIVVPAFNEEGTIRQILNLLLAQQLPGWGKEIIVVNDASTDRTKEILKEFEGKVRVIHLEKNSGKGSAVMNGSRVATGDYILVQDADLEYDPKEIPDLLRALDEKKGDVIHGSRNLRTQKREGSYLRRAGVWFLTQLFNTLYGTRLTDACVCYRLFPKSAAVHFGAGRFESELLFSAKAVRAGYKIAEVPVTYSPRTVAEGKKIQYRDGLIGIFALVGDWVRNLPKVALFLFGAIVVATAFIFSMSGVFNDRIDTNLYVSQIESFRGLFSDTPQVVTGTDNQFETLADEPWKTFKPLYMVLAALLTVFVHPYVAILSINLLLFVGLTFLTYAFLRELGFRTRFAGAGALWVVFSYPMLKYGLALGTDISGWFFSVATIVLMLRAVRTDDIRLVVLASLVGFLGSLGKETGAMGLIFAGFFLLWHFRVWKFSKLVKWLAALCIPAFALQGFLLIALAESNAPTFVDWYVLNIQGLLEDFWKLAYLVGVAGSAFNVLLPLALIGFVIAIFRRDIFKRSWGKYYIPLFLAALPVLLWPIFISRVLFIQFIFFVPLALYAVDAISTRFGARFPALPYILLALPPAVSIALFGLSGNGSLFDVFGKILPFV